MKAFFIKTNLFQQHYINVYYSFIETLKPKLIKLDNYDDILNGITDSFINENYKFIFVNVFHVPINEKHIGFIIYHDLFSINVKINKISYYIYFR
jgi:hypothetical protein